MQSTSHHITFFNFRLPTLFQADFTSRTVGYCLRKLRAIKKFLRKNVVLLSNIHILFLLSFNRSALRLLLCYFSTISRYGSSCPCTRVSVNTECQGQVHFLVSRYPPRHSRWDAMFEHLTGTKRCSYENLFNHGCFLLNFSTYRL